MWSPRKIQEITPHQVKERLDQGEKPILLDVRTPAEHEDADIGGELIPLGELSRRVGELDHLKEKEIIVYCRSGNRSAQAVHFLQDHGFKHVKNLRGGILQWARDVDPSVSPM